MSQLRFGLHESTSEGCSHGLQEVGRLGATMYFGELALLRSEPRAATVTALTDCDLLELGRADFMALMGPLAKTLEANTARYGVNFSAKKARPRPLLHDNVVPVMRHVGTVLSDSRRPGGTTMDDECIGEPGLKSARTPLSSACRSGMLRSDGGLCRYEDRLGPCRMSSSQTWKRLECWGLAPLGRSCS